MARVIKGLGIDLWSNWQQADNSREATLRNAALEGVADRVSVHDGDMRKLPFADRSFDAAVAHFAIHNITGGEGRREAIREIVRTLKQGGQVAISDLMAVDLYADELRKSAMTDVEISGLSFWTFPTARTVTARKPAHLSNWQVSPRRERLRFTGFSPLSAPQVSGSR